MKFDIEGRLPGLNKDYEGGKPYYDRKSKN